MKTRLVVAVLVLMAGLLILASQCTNDNVRPAALFTVDRVDGPSPLTVNFDGSGSYDPDGTIEDYSWNFDDGTSGTGVTTSRTFTTTADKTYTVRLTVTDNGGKSATTSATILVTGSGGGATLFFDDFEDGANPAWVFVTGEWSTTEGTLHLQDWHSSDQYAYVSGGETWDNYVVEADLQSPWGSTLGDHQGFIVRAQDDLNKVVFLGTGYDMYFVVFQGGKRIVSQGGWVDHCWTGNKHISVKVHGDIYEAYVDGIRVIQFTDSTFSIGTVGVVIGDVGEDFTVDNFKVTALE